MACRAALMTVLPPASFAIWLQPHTSSSIESLMRPAADAECQDTKEGTTCYGAVAWLRSDIFKKHPNWYPGYTSESSVEDVQDMLYGLGKASCPRPCFASAPLQLASAAELARPKFDCRDTVEGDLCYQGLAWLRDVGLELHPDWYPGLSSNSSVPAIQSALHRMGKADCPRPCALTEEQEAVAREAEASDPQPESLVGARKVEQAAEQPEESEEHVQGEGADCMDARPDTQCYSAVSFGVAEGVQKRHALYDGLREGATFKDIQEFLYLNNRSGCPRPCPEKHVPLDELVKNPESLRTKKRIEDMTLSEMSKYLTGEWDGYVARTFTTDNTPEKVSSTFAKREYEPTTTAVLEEAMPLPEVTAEQAEPPKAVNDTEASAENVTEASAENVTEGADETPIVTEDMANASTDEAVTEEAIESSLVPSTDAAREVMACLQNMSQEATPETFGDLRMECESVIADKLPKTGKQQAALRKETVRYFVWAQHHVEVLKAKAREAELEAMAKEEEAKAKEEEEKKEEQKKQEEKMFVDEPMPEVDGEGLVMGPEGIDGPEGLDPEQPSGKEETKEEMELRIRKQILEEMMTTTAAPHEETEEEMRQRIKAEVIRDLEEKAKAAAAEGGQ